MDPRTAEMLAERQRKASVWPRLWRFVRALEAGVFWLKAHRRVAYLTAAVSFILFVGAYQVQVAWPAEVRAKAEAEVRAVEHMKVQTDSRGAALEGCLDKTKADAEAQWNAQCRREGKRAGCYLSAKLTNKLQAEEGVARNACLMKYSLTQ
jgi:hypothetical protein